MNAINITGTVTDDTGEPLIEATLKLLSAGDSTYVKGVTSNSNGRFSFSGIKSGKYIVQCSYLGYNNSYTNVTAENSNIKLNPIVMKESSIMLKETVVTAVKAAIVAKEDTLEYNADSYKTQPNAVIEDLLKKLPGVEVGSDGSITAQGKSVSKILVDGKEFFADDPKIASKNLPVDMVEKLQVIDRKSDQARLTGVDDGEEETVINLTVKKGMNNGWFGTINAGYGTNDRYTGDLMINRFWDGNQFTILGNFNNTNSMGFTDQGSRFSRFGGSNGITTTQSLGMNFNVGKKDESFRVGGNVFYSHTDRNSITKSERQYLFTDSTSYQSSNSRSRDKGHNVRGDFRVQWKPDSFNTIEFRPRFTINFNNSTSEDSSITRAGDIARSLVTRSLNNSHSSGKSYEMSGELWYNHSFKNHPGRSFSISGNKSFSDQREDIYSYSYNLFKLFNDSIDLYDQYTDSRTWSNTVGARLTWTEPIGNSKNGRYLQFSYNMSYRWNNSDKLVYDHPVDYTIPTDPVIDYLQEVFNETLSNSFRNDFFNQRIQVGYRQVRKTYNLDAGITFVPSMSKSIDLINSARDIPERWVWNYSPYMRFRYKMGRNRNLNINYMGRTSEPSMSQLQPVADMSNPLRIVIGNPDLDPSFSHNVRINFNDFNMNSQRSVMASLNMSVTQNSIVSKTTYNSETGGQTTTYENVNGNWNANLFSMYSQPIGKKGFQINANLMASYNQNIGFTSTDQVNTVRNRSNNLNLAPSLSLAFRTSDIDLEIRPNFSWQQTRYTAQKNNNRNVKSYGGMFNGTWYTSLGIVLNTDLSYSDTKGYSAGYDQSQWMWNASISYQFLTGKTATIALKAYDLLQQKKNIQRSVTAMTISDTEYNSLTRYFMITFSYRFNTFGKNGGGNQSMDMVPGNNRGGNRGGFGGGGFGGGGFGGGGGRGM
jgi:hypothetical protein